MRYGLIGEKLGHSYSKIIQERLIDDYSYELIQLSKNELDPFMKEKKFEGINVTIPYKQAVIPYLDEIEDNAKKIQAVNTIVNKNGRLKGYNTDYYGFLYLLKSNGIDLKNKKVLVLGNGGGSKAIQQAVKVSGAKTMNILEHNEGSLKKIYAYHSDSEIIINTTPQGMFPNIDGCAIDINKFKDLKTVIDIVYNPLNTELLLRAKEQGIRAINGIKMLIAQAKYALELFKDIKILDDEIEKIYQELLYQKYNIVLIGMPSCGKTTIGKMLSNKIKKKSIDIDDEIIKKIKMPIADYFLKKGEKEFRYRESAIIRERCTENNKIISCGGGVIKEKNNIHDLKRNGVVVFIDRDPKDLFTSSDRPLASVKGSIEKLYSERIDLYKKYADIIIMNDSSLDNAVDEIIDKFTKYIKI